MEGAGEGDGLIRRHVFADITDYAGDGENVDPYVRRVFYGWWDLSCDPRGFALSAYPIPKIGIGEGGGKTFVDVGCNWGRWCIAAARRGYLGIGLDFMPEAVRAAKRVADELGLDCHFIIADARQLPLKKGCADIILSYNALQYMDEAGIDAAAAESKRVKAEGGIVFAQIASRWGIRNIYHRLRKLIKYGGAQPPKDHPSVFLESHLTRARARRAFSDFKKTSFRPEGFICMDPRIGDASMLPLMDRASIFASKSLTWLAGWFPPLALFADSVMVRASDGGGEPKWI